MSSTLCTGARRRHPVHLLAIMGISFAGSLSCASSYGFARIPAMSQATVGIQCSVAVGMSDGLTQRPGRYGSDFTVVECRLDLLRVTDTSFDSVLDVPIPAFATSLHGKDATGIPRRAQSSSLIAIADACDREGGFVADGADVSVAAVSCPSKPADWPSFASGGLPMPNAPSHTVVAG